MGQAEAGIDPRAFRNALGQFAPTRVDIAAMVARRLVTVSAEDDGPIGITDSGRRTYVVVLSTDGRIASKAVTGFSAREIAEFGGYLQRVIQNTNAGTPDVWTYSDVMATPTAG